MSDEMRWSERVDGPARSEQANAESLRRVNRLGLVAMPIGACIIAWTGWRWGLRGLPPRELRTAAIAFCVFPFALVTLAILIRFLEWVQTRLGANRFDRLRDATSSRDVVVNGEGLTRMGWTHAWHTVRGPMLIQTRDGRNVLGVIVHARAFHTEMLFIDVADEVDVGALANHLTRSSGRFVARRNQASLDLSWPQVAWITALAALQAGVAFGVLSVWTPPRESRQIVMLLLMLVTPQNAYALLARPRTSEALIVRVAMCLLLSFVVAFVVTITVAFQHGDLAP